MCKYENCDRKEYKGGKGYCLFHCDKEKFEPEEIEEFKNKFWEEFERQEKYEKEFNFS